MSNQLPPSAFGLVQGVDVIDVPLNFVAFAHDWALAMRKTTSIEETFVGAGMGDSQLANQNR